MQAKSYSENSTAIIFKILSCFNLVILVKSLISCLKSSSIEFISILIAFLLFIPLYN